MATSGQIHIVGRLTADPEVRFTPNGFAVANIDVAVNRQVNIDGVWKDDGADFYHCTIWRNYAENVVESLHKGDMVTVNGRMKSRTYVAKDDTDRTVWEIDIDEIGPSLRFATVVITKNAYADPAPSAEPIKPAHDPRITAIVAKAKAPTARRR